MSRIAASLLGCLGLCLDVLCGLALSPGTSIVPAALTTAIALAAFDHHRIVRWRRPSVLLIGSLASTGLILLGSTSLHHFEGEGLSLLGALAAPWPAHLVLRFGTWCWPKRPIVISGHGFGRRQTLLALRSTPGWIYVPVTTCSSSTTVSTIQAPSLLLGCASGNAHVGSTLLPLFPEGPDEGMGRRVKFLLDRSIALALFVATAPLVLILACVARATSKGPAFYAQERITRNGRLFRILKIRSMVAEAEADGLPKWPEENDPRITAFGRFLRRYWLDELPQLANVLHGTLSLVGPRPERPHFVQVFSERLPKYPLRHQVKAGITGLAQVCGFTGNTSLSRRLHLDLRYIRLWSPALDVWILLGTVLQAVRRPPIRPGGVAR